MSERPKLKRATEFSGYYKKEDSNNEERVLSEIKIAGIEEPEEKNVTMTKSSNNLDSGDDTRTRGHRH